MHALFFTTQSFPDFHVGITLGIIIGLLASIVQSLGLTIQRKSHILNGLLPQLERKSELRRPLWLLGFAIFFFSNILGSLVQIASLPIVILAPLGAVSLLCNAFFARFLLGDVFSPWMILGTLFITGGAVLIAFFGIVPEPTRSLEDLLELFSRPTFVAYFSLLGAGVVICLAFTHIVEFSFIRRVAALSPLSTPPLSPVSIVHPSNLTAGVTDAVTTERTPLLDRKTITSIRSLPSNGKHVMVPDPAMDRTRILLAISFASFSGILSGMCLLFAKSGVELLLLTLQGKNQFWRWQAWILVVGLVVFALLQLWYLHKALILADPTLVCPSATCFYNLSSIVNGLVYFNQFSLIPPLHLGLVVLGIIVLLVGVWVVSIKSGKGGIDIGTWQKGDDDNISIGECEEPEELEEETIHQQLTGVRPVSEFGSTSEPLLPTVRMSLSSRSPPPRSSRIPRPPTIAIPGIEVSIPTSAREERSPHERQATDSILLSPASNTSLRHQRTARLRRDSSLYHSLSPVGNAGGTLAAGFQIGLSPVSPGFSIIPRERRRRRRVTSGSRPGTDEADEGSNERTRSRRRTVSEGDVNWRTSGEGGEEGAEGLGDEGGPTGGAGLRWRWLRKVLRRNRR